ncbi:MAG: Nuclease, partial [Candidatus Acidoferrum typicum]|nr:Nuclease [Candidatus Acidoferrum typicum]
MRKCRSFVSRCVAGIAAAAVSIFVLPTPANAWGANAERLVSNKAVDTLPPEIRGYFEANRDWLAHHVTDPLDLLQKNSQTEHRNHFLYLDHYGKFPFDALPRDYKAAVTKFTKTKLESSGVLPWQIGVYSQKLTAAFRDHDWEQARLSAAYLAAYVAQAHDPFHTTENFDGHLSAQSGVDLRFGSSLVDRFSLFFPMRPNDAMFLSDPTDHAFDACMSAHAWLENILLSDRRAREGLSDYT